MLYTVGSGLGASVYRWISAWLSPASRPPRGASCGQFDPPVVAGAHLVTRGHVGGNTRGQLLLGTFGWVPPGAFRGRSTPPGHMWSHLGGHMWSHSGGHISNDTGDRDRHARERVDVNANSVDAKTNSVDAKTN
eukprot:7549069-Pyramimonas_sp.AAC.1